MASPAVQPAGGSTHSRTYQACLECRKRKVRCNLGDPDSPQPPCLRCRRENKDCYFSATRRKSRRADEELEQDVPVVVKRAKTTRSTPPSDPSPQFSLDEPRTPGGSVGRPQPLRRPAQPRPTASDDEDQAVNDGTAEILQKSRMWHGNDPITVLLHAARGGRTMSSDSLPRPSFAPDAAALHASGVVAESPYQSHGPENCTRDPPLSAPKEHQSEALQAWSKLRFVRAGLFTATEGIKYVQYFYRYLNPLTPVTVPDFQDASSHSRLLTDEPMLVVTILAVASRYMTLEGPGATSRAYTIHDKLWLYLQAMIQRLIWGQEQFGGGFCGGGLKAGLKPGTQKGLRTLGTVESLLLLTEWHTRALHFPPGDDNYELLEEPALADIQAASMQQDGEPFPSPGVGGKMIESWLEPCWRSDRMVWSLLGLAQSLAADIGVFGVDAHPDDHNAHGHFHNPAFVRRRENVRRQLYIYISLTSGRLLLPSIMPAEYSQNLFPDGQPRLPYSGSRRTVNSMPVPHSLVQDAILYFWYGLARVFSYGNQKLFPSSEATTEIIRTGVYTSHLQEFERVLRDWHAEFQACSIVPSHMRQILSIEYEYAVVYVNQLGLQAIIERCTGSMHTAENGIIPPDVLYRRLDGDRKYLQTIIKASQNFLRAVIGLRPDGYLKHSPVRTYMRIIAVVMVLLKTFALGAHAVEVGECFALLERATNALRNCVVDDVHVGSHLAELISIIRTRLQNRMVRIAAGGSARATSKVPNSCEGQATVNPSNGVALDQRVPLGRTWSQYQTHRSQSTMSPPAAPGADRTERGFSAGVQTTPYQDPLFGISPSMYDHTNPAFSIMPPSSFNTKEGFFGSRASNYPPANGASQDPNNMITMTDNSGMTDHDYDFASNNDWLALPLDPLLNNAFGGDVTQGGYGPDVGGRDMLDLLLMDGDQGGLGLTSNEQ